MTPVPTEPLPPGAEPAAAAPNGQNLSETTLSDAILIVRKRKYLILLIVLLGILYGLYQANTQPRLYESSGTIEIGNGATSEFQLGTGSLSGENHSRIPTEVTIIKSDTLLLTVARDLDLANNSAFTGYKGPPRHLDLDDLNVRQSILGQLQDAITVMPVTKTDIVRISCSTLDPKLSAAIVNKLVREYIQRSFQSRFDATQRVSDWLSHQLDDLKQQVETSQEQMVELGKQLGVLGFDPSHNQITSSLEDLTRAADQAQLGRIQAQSRYSVLKGMGPSALDASVDAGASPGTALSQLPALRAQRETARANLAKLTAPGNLGPKNPEVQALKDQIAELSREIDAEQSRLLEQAKENYVAARSQEQQTRDALEAEKAEAYRLRDAQIEMSMRQRDFDSNRTLYEGLLQKLRTAGVQAGLESTEIDIIDQAVPATHPSLRPMSTIIMVNSIVALIIALVLAFILDSLDTGLRSVAQIEAASGLVSLALVPRVRRSPADSALQNPVLRSIGVLANPKSQFAESFRALRTSLLLSSAGREPRTVLLTSATPSEGKTTASINLACVFAQRDVRVLLIDADLRRPTVHHRFNLNGKIGLTSVLTGSISLEDAVQKIPEVPSLDVLSSGPVPPFPTEMLSSEAMRQLLKHCEGIYTHVVMDSPPLLSVTDSVVLARDSDAVVLIVRQGKSSKHALRRARDLLVRSGARITGIVLNAVDVNSPEYYSYYGYYGYSAYSSAGVDDAGWEKDPGGPGPGEGDSL